jgi:hypothetical protein
MKGEGDACLVKSIGKHILKLNNAAERVRGSHDIVEL